MTMVIDAYEDAVLHPRKRQRLSFPTVSRSVEFPKTRTQEHGTFVGLKKVTSIVSRCLADNNAHGDYMIAGSYAAAVKAHMLGIDLNLPYNDIDVFIQRPRPPKYENTYILSAEKLTLPNLPTELNIIEVVKDCTLSTLILEHFDINAIRVGVQIRHKNLKQPIEPKESDWEVCPSYHTFLQGQRLKIHDLSKMTSPAACVIRLLTKASQMNFGYDLPCEEDLLKYVHEKCIGEQNRRKVRKLPSVWQEKFYRVFKLMEIPPRKSRKVTIWKLELKGHKSDRKCDVKYFPHDPY